MFCQTRPALHAQRAITSLIALFVHLAVLDPSLWLHQIVARVPLDTYHRQQVQHAQCVQMEQYQTFSNRDAKRAKKGTLRRMRRTVNHALHKRIQTHTCHSACFAQTEALYYLEYAVNACQVLLQIQNWEYANCANQENIRVSVVPKRVYNALKELDRVQEIPPASLVPRAPTQRIK